MSESERSESESSSSSSSMLKEEEKKPKRVVFNRKALSTANKSKFEMRTREVPTPELNAMMGAAEGELVVMVVRQMEFSELIQSQQDQLNYVRNLVEGVMEAVSSKEAVKEEVESALEASGIVASQRMDVVEKCLVEPKLSRPELTYIAKMFPSVPIRLYNVIMDLTNRGADLKKNSSD